MSKIRLGVKRCKLCLLPVTGGSKCDDNKFNRFIEMSNAECTNAECTFCRVDLYMNSDNRVHVKNSSESKQ